MSARRFIRGLVRLAVVGVQIGDTTRTDPIRTEGRLLSLAVTWDQGRATTQASRPCLMPPLASQFVSQRRTPAEVGCAERGALGPGAEP
jgi:hypothetical protein